MNCYEILEVRDQASPEVIRAAYKSLMQRHHPDKAPGDAETAQRAALITRAYKLLSDPVQRLEHDRQLASTIHAAERTAAAPARSPAARSAGRAAASARSGRAVRSTSTDNKRFAWYVGAIAAVIVVSGGLMLTMRKPASLPAAGHTPAEPPPAISAINPPVDLRSLQMLTSPMTVPLKSSALVSARPLENMASPKVERVLMIPKLTVRVGAYDSARFVNQLQSRRELIALQLAEKLANADTDELIKPGGEQYLKTLILDKLGEIMGTNHLEAFPPAGGEPVSRYGVAEVSLPDSFFLK